MTDSVIQVWSVIVSDSNFVFDGAIRAKTVVEMGYFASKLAAREAASAKIAENEDWKAEVIMHDAVRLSDGRVFLLASTEPISNVYSATESLRESALSKLTPAERKALGL